MTAFHKATNITNLNDINKDLYGSSNPPLYQTTTFKQISESDFKIGQCPDLSTLNNYDYTRSGNPTRTVLEEQVGKLYDTSGDNVFAVSSGMSALQVIIQATILAKVKFSQNPHEKPLVLMGDDIYGGTQRLVKFISNFVDVIHLNASNTELVLAEAHKYSHRLVAAILESPSNPLLQVVNLPLIASEIKKINPSVLLIVDNSMMSGLNCNPLTFGIDIVYESGTKYLNGHHDLMAGLIICKNKALSNDIYFVINSTGNGLSPFDSWLLIRGLKTLEIRLFKQQYNAVVLAKWLKTKCNIDIVRYIGLKDYHKDYELHKSFNQGTGAVISFQTGSLKLSESIVFSKLLKIFNVTVSFGCINSLISLPCKMSHASIDEETRKEREFPEDLIRLSIGIEDVEDLCADLLSSFVDAGLVKIIDNGTKILNLHNNKVAKNNVFDENDQIFRLPSIYDIIDTTSPSSKKSNSISKL
ncbi:hypothetical protein QEN19_002101 [Hanseniaspora menglaensis]